MAPRFPCRFWRRRATGPAARERRGTIAPTAIRPTTAAPFRHARVRPEGPGAVPEGGRPASRRRDNDDPPAEFRPVPPLLAQIFSAQSSPETAPGDGPAPAVRQIGIAAYRSAQSARPPEPDLPEMDGLLVVRDHLAFDLTV